MNLQRMSEDQLKKAWRANLRMQDKWCRALEKLYVEDLEPCAAKKEAAESIIHMFLSRMEEIEEEMERRKGYCLYLSSYQFLD